MSDDICVKCHSFVELEPGLEWDDEDEKMCHPCEIDSLRAEVSRLEKERDALQGRLDALTCSQEQVKAENLRLREENARLWRVLDEIGPHFVWHCEGPYGPSPMRAIDLLALIRDAYAGRIAQAPSSSPNPNPLSPPSGDGEGKESNGNQS